MKPFLIIGIDPGNTIGICALNFEGNPVHLSHIENGGIRETVSLIEKWGTPSLIACDVFPAPEFAIKLASYFNVKLSVPKENLREEEKKKIALKEGEKAGRKIAENAHERDALAAAIIAYRNEQNMLRSALTENIEKNKKEKLCHLLLQGYRKHSALEMLFPKKEMQISPIQKEKTTPSPSRPKSASSFLSRIHELERINTNLQKRISFLEHEHSNLIFKLRKMQSGAWERMMGEGEIRKLKAKNARLEERLDYFRKLLFILSKKAKKWKEKKENTREAGAGKKKDGELDGMCEITGEEKEKAGIKKKKAEEKTAHSAKSLKGLDSMDKLEQLVDEYRANRSSK
ncbi:MAG: DUF460 domain-containing protein [Candidatus Micrarchaeota archaeon]